MNKRCRAAEGYNMRRDVFLKWKQTEIWLQALIQFFACIYDIPKIRTWGLLSRMFPSEVSQYQRLFQFILKYARQVSIDFLIKYCVPVWYRWGPEEISMVKRDPFDRLAPPPDHFQHATFLTKVPSPQPAIPDRPWVAFFEKRQKDQTGKDCRYRFFASRRHFTCVTDIAVCPGSPKACKVIINLPWDSRG
jgi:hypothetical protein